MVTSDWLLRPDFNMPMDPMTTTPKISQSLLWATEMLLVYQNLGKLADPTILKTASAREVHRWIGEDEKNKLKFITDTVPKAAAIIEKNAPKDVSDAIREIDVKTITELQKCLSSAVQAATTDPPSRVKRNR